MKQALKSKIIYIYQNGKKINHESFQYSSRRSIISNFTRIMKIEHIHPYTPHALFTEM
ncbi:hypothetical protein F110043I8_19160 [Ruminococcus sp. f11]